MRLLILTIALLFTTSFATAQRITLNQIMKMQIQNPTQFEDYAIGLGLSPENSTRKVANLESYSFGKNITSTKSYLSISKYQ